MTEVKQKALDGTGAEKIREIARQVHSLRDYALYVEEMTHELARIANNARLPFEIGYLLRMASLAASQSTKGQRRAGLRRDEALT